MIYRLQNGDRLRGWKGANCAIVHRAGNRVQFVKPELFSLLLLCDGKTLVNEEELLEAQAQMLDDLIARGIVVQLKEPSPITAEQEYRQYSNRYVRSVLWSVTGKCNFKCRHCYMDAPNGVLSEISHEEAVSIIDQMAECGIQEVMLTGGETFVRADIWDLIQRIHDHGITISQIYTNAWLLNEKVLDRLDALGLKPEFSISFDCLGWHDWMRGVAGAEKQVLSAIRLCQSRGFVTSVETCVHRESLPALRDTIRLMGEMNTRIKVGSVMDTELWKKNGNGYGLTDKEYLDAMLKQIGYFFEDGMPADLTLGSVIRLNKGSKDYHIVAEKHDGTEECLNHHLCGAARMNAYITPEGRILPCMPMTAWEGHTCFKRVQEIGLRQGLTDSFYMKFVNSRIRDLLEKNPKCNACEHRLRCGGGCRACALADENDLFGSEHMQCFFWKNGYVDLIRQTTEAAIQRYCDP